MKHLGLTPEERDMRDLERRVRNCTIVLLAIAMLGSFFLGWSV